MALEALPRASFWLGRSGIAEVREGSSGTGRRPSTMEPHREGTVDDHRRTEKATTESMGGPAGLESHGLRETFRRVRKRLFQWVASKSRLVVRRRWFMSSNTIPIPSHSGHSWLICRSSICIMSILIPSHSGHFKYLSGRTATSTWRKNCRPNI